MATKEELKANYIKGKADILAQYGTPEKDFDGTPLNECAERLKALETAHRSALLRLHRESLPEEKLKNIVADVPKQRLKAIESTAIPELVIDEKHLKAFTEKEKDMLHTYFNHPEYNTQEIAVKHNTTRQIVAALRNDVRTKMLEAKLFDNVIPWRIRLALMRLVEANDSKVTLRLGEHYNIIKAEEKELTFTNKPIEDEKALEMLKRLGDKLTEE